MMDYLFGVFTAGAGCTCLRSALRADPSAWISHDKPMRTTCWFVCVQTVSFGVSVGCFAHAAQRLATYFF